jgi:DNA-binding MarR family transcriptional regulator
MHDLGEHVHVTQSALSRLVARLEADGLVERVMCTEDRRSVFAKLTPAGLDLYKAARPTQREVLRTTA